MRHSSWFVASLFLACLLPFFGCNVGDNNTVVTNDGEECVADAECDEGFCVDGECVECDRDGHCDEGVCSDAVCVECTDTEHCSDDLVCDASNQCVTGPCAELNCGPGGTCAGEDTDVSCECDEGYLLEEDVCVIECGENSERAGDVCECNEGFELVGDQCLIECGENSERVDDACQCTEGFELVDEICEEICDCEVENGTGTCDAGFCEIATCDEGFSTIDEDPATGCECADEDHPDPINFEDRNCDGVDGDASLAVFVSKFGDDSDDGIATRPVKTIARGIELALESDTRRAIYIGSGTYEERVVIEESISLFGGYRDLGAGNWDRSPDNETIISGEGIALGNRPVEIRGIQEDMEFQLLTIVADHAGSEFVDDFEEPGSSVGITLRDNTANIHISHTDIVAQRGADGLHGSDGADGIDGVDGLNGLAGQFNTNINNNRPPRAPQSCVDTDPAAGGSGGRGGFAAVNGANGGTTPAVPNAASGGNFQRDSNCGSPQSGSAGSAGGHITTAGDAGNDGIASTQDMEFFSTTEDLIYRGVSGADGEFGAPGGSGAGGGGGGGTRFFPAIGACFSFNGAGGASGATGGCGGSFGTGGQAGGASIGIIAVNS